MSSLPVAPLHLAAIRPFLISSVMYGDDSGKVVGHCQMFKKLFLDLTSSHLVAFGLQVIKKMTGDSNGHLSVNSFLLGQQLRAYGGMPGLCD